MVHARWSFSLVLASAALGQTKDAEFAKLADRYFGEVVFRFDPV
jgi:hypothetical protein